MIIRGVSVKRPPWIMSFRSSERARGNHFRTPEKRIPVSTLEATQPKAPSSWTKTEPRPFILFGSPQVTIATTILANPLIQEWATSTLDDIWGTNDPQYDFA